MGLCHAVVFAFVRIGTNPRTYSAPPPPLSLDAAAHHVRTWHERRVARILLPGAGHVDAVLELLRRAGATGGNLITNAQIAAVALAHRATVHTADQDFRRFPGLDCRRPLRD